MLLLLGRSAVLVLVLAVVALGLEVLAVLQIRLAVNRRAGLALLDSLVSFLERRVRVQIVLLGLDLLVLVVSVLVRLRCLDKSVSLLKMSLLLLLLLLLLCVDL